MCTQHELQKVKYLFFMLYLLGSRQDGTSNRCTRKMVGMISRMMNLISVDWFDISRTLSICIKVKWEARLDVGNHKIRAIVYSKITRATCHPSKKVKKYNNGKREGGNRKKVSVDKIKIFIAFLILRDITFNSRIPRKKMRDFETHHGYTTHPFW